MDRRPGFQASPSAFILPEANGSRGSAVRGQGLVEFALILPFLLLVVFGIIEFGRFMAVYIGVTSSSREAARYGSGVGLTNRATLTPPYQDCDGIEAVARRLSVLLPLDSVAIEYDNLRTLSDFQQCPPPRDEVVLGSRISVTVTATYRPFAPLVDLPPIPIRSTSKRSILKEVWLEDY